MRPRTVVFLLLLVFLPFALPGPGNRTTLTEGTARTAARHDFTAYTLPPARLARARALYHQRLALHITATLATPVLFFLLLELGVAPPMRTFASRFTRNPVARNFLFCLQFFLLVNLLALPFDAYAEHLNRLYGLSIQPWYGTHGWLVDQLKSFALTFVVGGTGVLLLFFLIRRFPIDWWVSTWALTVLTIMLAVFVAPTLIDPLFNHFEPLSKSSPALVAQLEKAIARAGATITPDRILLMRASTKTTTLNAYVTGFGASKRVVVWDTALQQDSPDGVLFIFGHELGHYLLRHILHGILVAAVTLMLAFYLGFNLAQFLLARFGARWHITAQQDLAALPVYLLVFALLSIPAEPIANSYSRLQEHAADVYSQELLHTLVPNPTATAVADFNLLGINSLETSDHHPFFDFWFSSHPPLWYRAAFAAHYNPWTPTTHPKYFPKP